MAAQRDFVLIFSPDPEDTVAAQLQKLRKLHPDVEFTHRSCGKVPPPSFDIRKQVSAELWQATTILVTIYHLPASPDDAPNLRWVHLFSAGYDHVLKSPIAQASGIAWTTSSGCSSPRIAEWVMYNTLAHFHRFQTLQMRQKEKRWDRTVIDVDCPRDMVGARIGIIGYGSIGRAIGRVAHALGMKVMACNSRVKDTAESRRFTGFSVPGTGDPEGAVPEEWYGGDTKESLNHFLAQDLHVVVVSCPASPGTQALIGTAEFDTLSKCSTRQPFFLNVARGTVIDQEALVDALEKGKLAGAAIDVTDPEPLPADSRLWDAPNLVITPHVSSTSSNYFDTALQLFEINLGRSLKGDALINERRLHPI